jgi:transcriptional regulator with XRE-family HTH domain
MHTFDWGSNMSRKPRGSAVPAPVVEDESASDDTPAPGKKSSDKSEALFATVAQKIVERRKALNLTQAQLARAAECPVSTLFSAETGQHNTSIGTLQKIAEALKVDMWELLPRGRSEPPNTIQGIAMLQLIEGALQTTLGESNRTTAMLQHVIKMVRDANKPVDPGGSTEH